MNFTILTYAEDAILAIKAESTKAKKKELLAAACSIIPGFKHGIELALDIRYRFFTTKIPEYDTQDYGSPYSLAQLLQQISAVYNRDVTGNAASKFIERLLCTADTKDAKFLERVILKSLDCGVGSTTVAELFPELLLDVPVMLCDKLDEKSIKKMQWPAIIQPKMDGTRCMIQIELGKDPVLHMRSAKTIPMPLSLADDIARITSRLNAGLPGIVIDGELLVSDSNGHHNRQTGNGILAKFKKGNATEAEIKSIQFVAWDVVPLADFNKKIYSEPYYARLEFLKSLLPQTYSNEQNIKVIRSVLVNELEDATAFYDGCIVAGLEGAVLKNPSIGWSDTRSSGSLKMKAVEDMDMFVVGSVEGRGKYLGMLGSLVVESEDRSIRCEVGTGLTDEQRVNYWNEKLDKGTKITVRYNQVISARGSEIKSLYLPVFDKVRID